MNTKNRIKTILTLAVAAMAILAASAQADLVAYWPLNDGADGTTVTGADDVIDAGLTFTDATPNSNGDTWVFDATRNRIVLSTTEGNRLTAGTQGIDLADGFTWSLWVNVAFSNIADPGADVIMGSRTGIWNKLQPTDLQRWADISGYDVADDTWHHMAVVGTTEPRVSLYIDGSLIGSDTTFWNDATIVNDKLEFGGSSLYSEDITGLMSDIAIWNEALSETQIQALAAGASVFGNVDAGVDMISWSGQGVTLDPSFVEGYTPISYAWTTNAPAGFTVEWDPSNIVEAPTVTITKDAPTGDVTIVQVTLTADDGTGPEPDTMKIDLYDDNCQAAKATNTAELDPTDFDDNCITNLADFAVLAADWLVDYELTEPVIKP